MTTTSTRCRCHLCKLLVFWAILCLWYSWQQHQHIDKGTPQYFGVDEKRRKEPAKTTEWTLPSKKNSSNPTFVSSSTKLLAINAVSTDKGDSTVTLVSSAVQRLGELGVNLLALDFDLTVVDLHTHGRWKGTAQALQRHVRPEFLHLMPSCLARNISVAVVTFSRQTDLIQAVVGGSIMMATGAPSKANIPVRGGFDGQVGETTRAQDGGGNMEDLHSLSSRKGKQVHMALVRNELRHQYPHVGFSKRTTVLVDDDPRNIQHALRDGTRAVQVDPDNPRQLLLDLIKLQ